MLIPILITVAAIVALFVVIVAMRPKTFRILRSARMDARPAEVFAEVNDLRRWEAWSPWAKIDPACVMTYSGAPSGKGAVAEWNGNKKVGAGRMTIIQSRPGERVGIKLEFMRPWKATNQVEFTFEPQGDQTQVTWSMAGDQNFMCKAFTLFFSMEDCVGTDFEKGLARLKAVAEGAPAEDVAARGATAPAEVSPAAVPA